MELTWGPENVEAAIAKWRAELPVPHDLNIPRDDADIPPHELRRLLREFGSWLIWLREQQGILLGRASGYKQAYEAGLSALKGASLTELPKTATEAAKESWALNHPVHGETLRRAHRMQMELDGIVLAQKGLIDALQGGWETVSRLITAVGIDVELNRGT